MKKTFKIVAITSVLCALAFSATLFSCKKVTDGIRVKVNTDIFTSPIGVHFVNYNTTSGTRPTDFSIKISGKDAALVYTSDGGSNYNVFGGFISLAVYKSAAPSPTHPVNFTITGSISGFAPIVYQVSITSDSAVSIIVPVIEYANPPANTVVLSTQVGLTGNASPAKALTAVATPTLANPATINIANGTTFKDASGNVISGNTLGVVATQYGTDSFNSIPGGLSPTDVLDINGSPIPGGVRFESAGSLAMQMNVDGVPVKSFGTPLQVNMPIDASLLNLATGNTVAAGDVIPVWSMDETTGQFKNEGNATVALTGGKLVATFPVSHLSVWNLAWPSNPCPTPLHLTINTSDPNYSGGNYRIAIIALPINGNGAPHVVGQPIVTSIYNGMTIDITNTPTNVQGEIVIYGPTGPSTSGVIAGSAISFCSTNSTTITVPVPSPSVAIHVITQFVGYCTDKQVTANLTGTFSYTSKPDALDFGNVNVRNGYTRFSILEGSAYTINAIYNNKPYTADITFTKTNFKFPGNSSITNGIASYDANANVLALSGQLNFSCK